MTAVRLTVTTVALVLANLAMAGGSSQLATIRAVEEQHSGHFRVVIVTAPREEPFFGAGCKAIIITDDPSGSIRNPPGPAVTTAKTSAALRRLRAALTRHEQLRVGGMLDAFDNRSPRNRCEFLVHGLAEVEEYKGVKAVYAYR
jgi:hypothetical protein